MAALEAEKWLAENEVGDVENGVEATEHKKGVNGDAPQYSANPLL